MIRLFSGLLLSLPLLAGCLNSHERKTVEKEIRPDVSSLEIPVALWERIERIYKAEGVKTAPAAEAAGEGEAEAPEAQPPDPLVEAKSAQIPLQYMKIAVELREAERGVLGGENLLLHFGQGGGNLDFADYVKGRKGGFRFGMKIEMLEGEVEKFKVLFWPNGRRRKINGTIFGSACDKILDVTDYFQTKILPSGIQVAVTSEKYITLLAGTYIFAIQKNNTLFIAQLSVKDSRYPILQCRT